MDGLSIRIQGYRRRKIRNRTGCVGFIRITAGVRERAPESRPVHYVSSGYRMEGIGERPAAISHSSERDIGETSYRELRLHDLPWRTRLRHRSSSRARIRRTLGRT